MVQGKVPGIWSNRVGFARDASKASILGAGLLSASYNIEGPVIPQLARQLLMAGFPDK